MQAKIPNATRGDLLTANLLLEDAKKHADVEIRIQSIPPEQIRFMSFSDVAFASRKRAHSQRGTFILATTSTIAKGPRLAPWSGAPRESLGLFRALLPQKHMCLLGALDQLSWVRLHWQWMRDPTTAWNKPDETLTKIPLAYAVVDCKSLYDLQKTTIPQCSARSSDLGHMKTKVSHIDQALSEQPRNPTLNLHDLEQETIDNRDEPNLETPMPDASQAPIPPDTDDDLYVESSDQDEWKITGNLLTRYHRNPRLQSNDRSLPEHRLLILINNFFSLLKVCFFQFKIIEYLLYLFNSKFKSKNH